MRGEAKQSVPLSSAEIVALVKDVEGFLDDQEIKFLYQTARDALPAGATIVEIGSFKGKSTILLARGLKDGQGGRIYAIDPHVGSAEHKKEGEDIWTFDAFIRNVRTAGVEDLIVPVVEFSHKAALDLNLAGIDMLWIDGAHDYDSVLADYESWEPRLRSGGVIAFHDTLASGPHRVVRRHVFHGGRFSRVRFVRSVVCARKDNRRSMAEKLRNFWRCLLWECYTVLARSSVLRGMVGAWNRWASG